MIHLQFTLTACQDHKGCNEWDFIGYLNAYSSECSLPEFTIYEECIGEVLSEYATQELCEAAGHRWDAGDEDTSARCEGKWNRAGKLKLEDTLLRIIEGRYISDVSPMLGVLKNEDINEFNYWQPNAYGLTVKLFSGMKIKNTLQ